MTQLLRNHFGPHGMNMQRVCFRLFDFSPTKGLSLLFLLVLIAGPSFAQNLPPPSRTVFKCEAAGKVIYSDSPCPGAARIEIEPTRGLNKSSGRELVGTDVLREKNREAFAEAIRPITGMDARQLEVQGRRLQLPPESRRECQRIDAESPNLEIQEKRTTGQSLMEVQARLFTLRKRFKELKC